MTAGRYRDESINPPFHAEPEELAVVAPLLPQQQRRIDLPQPTELGSVGLTGRGARTYPDAASTSAPEPAEWGRSSEDVAEDIDQNTLGATAALGITGSLDSAEPTDEIDPSGSRPGGRGPAAASPRHKPWPSPRQQIATGIMVLCTLVALFLLGHRFLPNSMGLVSLLESWLPWLAIPIALLLLGALAVRTPRALVAAVIACAVWLAGYGPALLPRGGGLPAQLRVFSADVNGLSGELSRAGALALAQHADVIALQDVYGDLGDSPAAAKLNAAFPANNHVTQYEFGVWSRYPIVNSTPIDLGTTTAVAATGGQGLVADGVPQQDFGALRVTIDTPEGDLVVYAVHIPQPVLNDNGFAQARDTAITRLAAVISADHSSKLIVVGAVNVAATDREFSVLQQDLGLTSAQSAAGQGFGFTWPAEFPAVRLDDLLTRSGVTAVRSVVLPAIGTGKTHLPIEVDLHL